MAGGESAGWDAASEGYAKEVAPRLMKLYVEDFVGRLAPEAGWKALEVAAGSGALTEVLAPRVASLLATDFAPSMLAVNRERMSKLGRDNVSFEVMDGQALTLDDDTFDCAGCCFGLMLFPDRSKGFAELRRVVRPGGRVMVSAWAGPDRFEGFGLFLAALRKAFPDMPPPPAPPPLFSLSNLDAFRSEMEAAGFESVETGEVTRELSVANFDEYWSMMTSGAPPIQELFDRVGEHGRAKVHAALVDVVTEKFGNGPIATQNTATVAVGTVG